MNNDIQKYLGTLKHVYRHGTSDHEEHNANEDYFTILLSAIVDDPSFWKGRTALDFGCGKGRNIFNLGKLAQWYELIGVDISQKNIDYCLERIYPNPTETKYSFYCNNGDDLNQIETSSIDFVLSTIVFQHICVHSLRMKLMSEIYRVLAPDGKFSFQMGCDRSTIGAIDNYYDDACDAKSSNGDADVYIVDPTYLVNDLKAIGFYNVEYNIKPSFSDNQHPEWIYVTCVKG